MEEKSRDDIQVEKDISIQWSHCQVHLKKNGKKYLYLFLLFMSTLKKTLAPQQHLYLNPA